MLQSPTCGWGLRQWTALEPLGNRVNKKAISNYSRRYWVLLYYPYYGLLIVALSWPDALGECQACGSRKVKIMNGNIFKVGDIATYLNEKVEITSVAPNGIYFDIKTESGDIKSVSLSKLTKLNQADNAL